MKRAPFFLIFAILITACAAPTSVPPTATLTPMTPIATLEPSPTATPPAPTAGATFGVDENGQVTIGCPPRAPEKGVPTATPEPLLPPDFTVKNWREFRTAILPYCYVRADLSDSKEGVDKVWDEIQGTEIFRMLMDRRNRKEIFTFGSAVAPVGVGGGCGIISIWKDMSNESGAFFQSRLNPDEWIEIKFTDCQ